MSFAFGRLAASIPPTCWLPHGQNLWGTWVSSSISPQVHSLKLTVRPWKWMVGRCISFWDGLFSGAMLVSGTFITSHGGFQIITPLTNTPMEPSNKKQPPAKWLFYVSGISWTRWGEWSFRSWKKPRILPAPMCRGPAFLHFFPAKNGQLLSFYISSTWRIFGPKQDNPKTWKKISASPWICVFFIEF